MVPKNRNERPNNWNESWIIRRDLRHAILEFFLLPLVNPVVLPPLKSIVDGNLKTEDCPGIEDCQLACYPEDKEGWYIKCSDSERSHFARSLATDR
jgi:hypothetical protein